MYTYLSVASTVFYKEQPVLEFMKDILFDDLQRGNRHGGGGRGGRFGGRGRGAREQSSEGGERPAVPHRLNDFQRKKFLKEIKG